MERCRWEGRKCQPLKEIQSEEEEEEEEEEDGGGGGGEEGDGEGKEGEEEGEWEEGELCLLLSSNKLWDTKRKFSTINEL